MDEAPVWIAINGERRIMLTCTPTELPALAVGHLLTEGWISGAGDVAGVRAVHGPGSSRGVEVSVERGRVEAADALRRHQLAHGCGIRHFLDCERQPATVRPAPSEQHTTWTNAFRALFAAADRASPDGGVHAAALCDHDGELVHVAVDVARHCATDRVFGTMLLAEDHAAAMGLVLTSRVSGAIALKAVRAGVGWIASRSRGTPLAREIAAAAGLPLLERAARRESGS